jgi:aspartyl-tRNA(Asn)/glutamyl-tRNA(Gln) amidotransferase subunit A
MSPAQQALTDPDFQAQAAQGAHYTFTDIHRLQLRRAELGSMMRQFMQRYDVLVTPTVAVPAFEARAAGEAHFDAQQFLGWTPFSYPFNLTQQPAITVPCGLTTKGLPIGLQIVGPMFDDALVLRVARAYESVKPVARPAI